MYPYCAAKNLAALGWNLIHPTIPDSCITDVLLLEVNFRCNVSLLFEFKVRCYNFFQNCMLYMTATQ